MKTDEVVAVSAVVNSEDKDTKVVSDLAKSSVETKPEVVAPVVVEATNNRVGIVNPKKVNPPIVVETPKTVIPTKIESNPVKLEMITGVLEIMQDGLKTILPMERRRQRLIGNNYALYMMFQLLMLMLILMRL